MHTSPISRASLLAYTILLICATLYPLSGWRDVGVAPWAFLITGWQRHWTVFDIGFNVAGYMPLGALLVWSLYPLMRGGVVVAAATVAGGLLSLTLEGAQTYLPTRVPSVSDLIANTSGCLLGAALAAWLTVPLLERGAFVALRKRFVQAGATAGQGAALLALWMLAQMYPEPMLFGNGRIANALGLTGSFPFSPDQFVFVEAAVTACFGLAAGLLSASLATGAGARVVAAALALGLGLALKSLGWAMLFKPAQAFDWFTPGAARGLTVAGLGLVVCLFLPRVLRMFLGAIAITFGAVMVNLAPDNPYHTVSMAQWNQTRWFNFVGLMELVSAVWPTLALLYLAGLMLTANRGRA